MDLCGDAPAVVFYGNAVVDVEGDANVGAIADERFVYRVIDDLEDEMVETSLCGVPDVHTWSLPHGFETFENFNLVNSVVLFKHVFLRENFITQLFF